jgi:hypothetical protein
VYVVHVDTCKGATVQYFHDDVCTVYAGSSNVKAESLGCRRLPGTSYFSTVSCKSTLPGIVPADEDDQ